MTEETSDELKSSAQERSQPQSQLEQSEQERSQLKEPNSECKQQQVQSEPKSQEQLPLIQSATEEVSLAQSLSKIAETFAELVVALTQQVLPTLSQLSTIEANLQQAAVERSQLKTLIEANLQQAAVEHQDTPSSPVSELQERLDPSKEDLPKSANHQVSLSPSGTASSEEETTTAAQDTQKFDSQSQQPSNYPPPSSEESNLVEKYNSERDSLSDIAKEVSETEESQNQRRLGTSQSAVFETKHRGNYWIITQGGFEYLVPKGNFKINKFNYTTVEFLFECQGYQSGQSKDFKLIKPAKVSSLPGGEKWQLALLGILQFQSSE